MVTQLSPHTDPARASAHTADAASTQKLKPEKSKLGVFAKILAGLTERNRAGWGETQGLPEKNGGEEQIPGIENAEKLLFAEAGLVHGEKGKKNLTGKAGTRVAGELPAIETGANESKKPSKTGEHETGLPYGELSAREKNILFTVDRLTGQAEETAADNSPRIGRKTGQTETITAGLTQDEAVQGPQNGLLTGNTVASNAQAVFSAAELGENPKNTNEKGRIRLDRVESTETKDIQAAFLGKQEAQKAVSGEKEGRNRLEEARNREKKRGVTFDVQDFRSAGEKAESAVQEASLRVAADVDTRVEGAGKDIILELRLSGQGRDPSSAVSGWETKSGQAFEDLLARELHQNFNNDIVRHASIALRDHNEGTIRLALKPESLGNVKIHLEMAENKITGHIIVESEEALRAFEREIGSLEKAFRDSGFEGANLEMSLAADGRGADQGRREAEASRFPQGQIAASHYDAAVERVEMPFIFDAYHQGAGAINVLV